MGATEEPKDGNEVMLPLLPGPFGDNKFKLTDKLDKSETAHKGAGNPSRRYPTLVVLCRRVA